jgi:hypothetical protein
MPDAAPNISKAAQAVRDVILAYVDGGGTVLPGEPVPWTRAAKAAIDAARLESTHNPGE